MRYTLGYMDKYPLEVVGSVMENTPMIKIAFKEPINHEKLSEAVKKALTIWPLFGTKVGFDKEYYLETNTEPLVILETEELDRPTTFGVNTHGYPWRMTHTKNTLSLEWAHCVTDGVGALDFLNYVLAYYFDIDIEVKDFNTLLGLGLEPFNNPKEKGQAYHVDPAGFSFKKFPLKYKDYRTDCYTLEANSYELISLAKESHSSVACILAVLFSSSLRGHLPKEMKNKRVACNMVINLRKSLNYQTIHNCVDYKRLTYLDNYEHQDLKSVAQTYKSLLDNARIKENVIRSISERIKLFKCYHLFPSRKWLKFISRIIGKIFKNKDCNFVLTYLGKVNFSPEISDKIENVEFKVWHDSGQCALACAEYNGHFVLNICENFVEEGIVQSFINLSREYGIHWTVKNKAVFTQSHFEE